MNITPPVRCTWSSIILVFFLLFMTFGVSVLAEKTDNSPEPAVYLNFNEGSGNVALDASVHGNAGTIHNLSRVENGGCGQALVFSRSDSYAAIPFRSLNHPTEEITVSAWFYVENFQPQELISSYNHGGYRLAIDDGGDLWWTVSLEGRDVSVPVLHEGITPHQWHYVAGTYDGKSTKIYLDGILRNQADATGPIHYQENNYIMLGADAGRYDTPDLQCPHYFKGGLDEVRIYPVALTYGEVMDDRFLCSQELMSPPADWSAAISPDSCEINSGAIRLGAGEIAERILSFSNKSQNGTWQISLLPGSILSVKAFDAYSKTYPDAWYLEMSDEHGKISRTIAFPNKNNAPLEGSLPSGNATVLLRYFDGAERFPAHVVLQLESQPPPPPEPALSQTIMSNPIIVIYSASWATLIAIVLVIVWLHRRRNKSE
jgi:hypothetical protein